MKGAAWIPGLVGALLMAHAAVAADPSRRFVYPGDNGKLVYDTDARGNRIPDFSYCGYAGGGVAIPEPPARVQVLPSKGDNTARIQAAIDQVAALPADSNGLRGAVLLGAGRHEIAGQLHITASGVVLRGQGQGRDGTVLVATGTDRRTLIRIVGKADSQTGKAINVTDSYVPVGTCRLCLSATADLRVGDPVIVRHPSTKAWIAAVGMDRFPSRDAGSWLDWQPGKMDIRWERTITRIDADAITLDAPLTTAVDAAHGTAQVYANTRPGRLRNAGVENLRCESTFDRDNPLGRGQK